MLYASPSNDYSVILTLPLTVKSSQCMNPLGCRLQADFFSHIHRPMIQCWNLKTTKISFKLQRERRCSFELKKIDQTNSSQLNLILRNKLSEIVTLVNKIGFRIHTRVVPQNRLHMNLLHISIRQNCVNYVKSIPTCSTLQKSCAQH